MVASAPMANRAEYVVPCNGCTLCCRGDAVRLLPADDPSLYKTEPHWKDADQLMLAHKPNGDCWYLDDSGCTIHDTSPTMCKKMDCRTIAARVGFTHARVLGVIHVWRRGKQLLREARNAA